MCVNFENMLYKVFNMFVHVFVKENIHKTILNFEFIVLALCNYY